MSPSIQVTNEYFYAKNIIITKKVIIERSFVFLLKTFFVTSKYDTFFKPLELIAFCAALMKKTRGNKARALFYIFGTN